LTISCLTSSRFIILPVNKNRPLQMQVYPIPSVDVECPAYHREGIWTNAFASVIPVIVLKKKFSS
jgi:hypothetical protein